MDLTFEEIVEKFKQYPKNMEMGAGKLSNRYGVSKEMIQKAKDQVRGQKSKEINEIKSAPQADRVVSFKENSTNNTAELTAILQTEIRTLDELIQRCNIDIERWEIDKYVQNFWGNPQNPCFQVKAYLSPKKEKDSDIIADLFENYKSNYVPLTYDQLLQNKVFDRKTMLLISMADFHLDKRTLDGKTLEDKVKLYHDVVSNLVFKAYKNHNIDEITYLIGNDFMHTDNYQEATTKGTPQQVSTSWNNAYEVGFDLQVQVISKLKQFCNKLKIIHIPSNHSRTKEYYMAHALSVYFSTDKNISFDRTADSSKCLVYGNTFLGFAHGDVRSFDQLPTYFSSKYRKEWGNAVFSEIALADKHHRKEWKHALTKGEVHGTRMFILPSLSGSDTWHKDSFYDLAIQASVARLYDYEKGYCGEIEERP